MTSDEHNEQQRRAIEHTAGPLLILAGAGTGKTRVIVEKVGYLLEHVSGLRPENILALTFTDKAAKEMRERAAKKLAAAAQCRFSTFHSFCNQLLLEEAQYKALDEPDEWIFLRRNLERLDLNFYLHVSEPGRFLSDLLEFCSRCQDNLVTPQEYAAFVEQQAAQPAAGVSAAGAKKKRGKRAATTPEEEIARRREVSRVFALSEELQQQARLVSFGAMISRAAALLQGSEELRTRMQRRYRFLLVDEFQDTNWAQIELLRLLAGERRNLAVVGDPNQAIYHFRGASYTSFQLFEKTFPGCTRVELSENYRSTRQILEVARTAISFSPPDPDQPPTQHLFPAKMKPEGPRVEVWEFLSEDEQAEFLARELSRRVREGELRSDSDFAVLYRSHRHRNRLVAALRRHGVPFAIRKLSINQLPAVRDAVAALRSIGHPADSVSLLRFLRNERWQLDTPILLELCRAARSARCSLGEALAAETQLSVAEVAEAVGSVVQVGATTGQDGLWRASDFLAKYREIAREERLGDWLNGLHIELGLFPQPEDEMAWSAFSSFILRWEREKSATGLLGEFLEYWGYFEEAGGTISLPDEEAGIPRQEPAARAEFAEAQQPSTAQQRILWESARANPQGKVQLMTMHSAKGLEFEHVFLLHLLNRAFPTRRQSPLIEFPVALLKGPAPRQDVHTEEERRLFYVALTRAKSTLTLCTVSNARQSPSPFLDQLRNSRLPEIIWKRQEPIGAEPAAPPPSPLQAPARDAARDTARYMARYLPAADELVLSASGVETYLECPAKYCYSSVWQVPVQPSAALRFGSVMHSSLKQVVAMLASRATGKQAKDTTKSDTAENIRAQIESILLQHWRASGFAEPLENSNAQERRYWKQGVEQLEGLWQAAAAKPFQLLGQEKSFHFVCGGTQVAGRIDQLNRIAGKRVELIEYKTGRVRTQKEADESLQMTLYARACGEALGLEPDRLVLYNLATQERLETERTAQQFRELDETLRSVSVGITAAEFAPTPGFHCRYCDFRTVCPAQEEQT